MSTVLENNLQALCVAAVNDCIQARNEMGFIGDMGVSIHVSQLGVSRMSSSRVDTVIKTMGLYGIKGAHYNEWGTFRGELCIKDAVISPTNIPLLPRAKESSLTTCADNIPTLDIPDPLFGSVTVLGDLREPIAVIMNKGVGVEVTDANRAWAEEEYAKRLLAATGMRYRVKLNKKNKWRVVVEFDSETKPNQL